VGTKIQHTKAIEKLKKIAKRFLAGFLIFLVTLSLILSIPAVQTYLAKKVTTSINEKYKTNISIGKVDLSFLGSVSLRDIYIEDYKQDTLIFAAKLNTSLVSAAKLFRGQLELGSVKLEDFVFNMKLYEGESLTNLDIFTAKFEGDNPDAIPRDKPFFMRMKSVLLINGVYRYYDYDLDSPEIVDLSGLNAYLEDFVIEGPEVTTDIQKLSFNGFMGLEVKQLAGNFAYLREQIRLDNMRLKTAYSSLNGNFAFNFKAGDFKDFNNLIQWNFKIDEASVAMRDINLYYDEFGQDVTVELSTHMTGTLNHFHLDDLKMNSNIGTSIDGYFTFKNIFNDADFVMESRLSDLTTSRSSLVALMPNILGNDIPEITDKLGRISTFGIVELNGNLLKADVDLETQIGKSILNFEMLNLSDAEKWTYSGNVQTTDFELGTMLDNPTLGNLTMDVNAIGSGLNRNTLNTTVFGTINAIGYNQYDFTNINLSGNIVKGVFEGTAKIDDYNLKAEVKGLADFSQAVKKFALNAKIPFANLYDTNLYTQDKLSVFSGNVDVDFSGTELNDFVGYIQFTNTTYGNVRDEYYFDDFTIRSDFMGDEHLININSKDIIDGEVKGYFKIEEIGSLVNNALGSIYTNYVPQAVSPGQYANFKFDVYNKLLDAFFPGIVLGAGTQIKGSLNGNTNQFEFSFDSSNIAIYDNEVKNFTLTFDNQNPLFNTYVEASEIHSKYYDIQDFSLVNINARDTLFFRSEFDGGKKGNDRFELNFYHTINKENRSVVGFKKSDLTFKGSTWSINKEGNNRNYLVFDEGFKNFSINQIVAKHQNEEIGLNGVARDSSYKDLKFSFKNVHLEKITPDIDSLRLDGLVNGNILLLQSENEYFPTSFLTIDDFEINKTQMGDLRLDVIGSDNLTEFDVDASLRKNNNFESLSAEGKIFVGKENTTLNIDVALNNLNLKGFSPLGGTAIDRIRGNISGNALLTGSIENPNWAGSLTLNDAGLRIPYLNVDLDFPKSATVSLTDRRILFDAWKVTDVKYKTTALLNGSISHDNFVDWRMDMNLDTDRLLVLDTQEDIVSLYYGTGFISGSVQLYGPMDNLVIDVQAQTQRGTNFVIPISDAATVGDSSFIRFITPEEKKLREQGLSSSFDEIKGLSLNFDLDVTQEALIEVQIDKENGSSLRGNGVGNLLIEINTNGKFNMWGDFIAMNGNYGFKYKGIIDKKFEVIRGGTITWDGDPMQAQVNIQAVYKTESNPSILLEAQSVTRKIPTFVYITILGNLTQPELDFTIDFPNATAQVKSEIQFRLDDDEQRQTQALSLISAGTFFNNSSTFGQAGANLFSESASNIVNDLFQDDNNKFNLGIDYVQADRTPDYEAEGRVGVAFETQLSDRVLINGKVGVPTGGVSQSVVVGDVEVEFLLNENGTLRAKVFNRQTQVQFIGEQEGYTQGVGLSYQVDFETFKELMQRIFKSKKEKQIIELPKQTTKPASPLPGFIEFKNN
jgi:hypothetical protein